MTIPKPQLGPEWDLPVNYQKADITAIQALEAGQATEQQQQRALRFIVEELAGNYKPSQRSEGWQTSFTEGRRCVGLMIVTATKMSLDFEDNA